MKLEEDVDAVPAGADIAAAARYDEEQQQQQQQPPLPRGPRDGPALTFEADPLVAMLVADDHKQEHEDNMDRDDGSCFGIVVAAGWPPNKYQVEEPYRKFRDAVEQCWDECDYRSSAAAAASPPPVYFYPYTALHVTAATMVRPRPSHLIEGGDDEIQNKLVHAWRNIVQKAASYAEWPTKPLSLEIETAQIGKKAGIILWRETTGGMRAIRHCLQRAFEQERATVFDKVGISSSSSSSSDLIGLDIPPIIHSTFMRYYSVPKTSGNKVQQRFFENVLKKLNDFFPNPTSVPVTKLVCERTPYMHISHNSNTVLATSFLSSEPSQRYITDCHEAEDILNRIHAQSSIN